MEHVEPLLETAGKAGYLFLPSPKCVLGTPGEKRPASANDEVGRVMHEFHEKSGWDLDRLNWDFLCKTLGFPFWGRWVLKREPTGIATFSRGPHWVAQESGWLEQAADHLSWA